MKSEVGRPQSPSNWGRRGVLLRPKFCSGSRFELCKCVSFVEIFFSRCTPMVYLLLCFKILGKIFEMEVTLLSFVAMKLLFFL